MEQQTEYRNKAMREDKERDMLRIDEFISQFFFVFYNAFSDELVKYSFNGKIPKEVKDFATEMFSKYAETFFNEGVIVGLKVAKTLNENEIEELIKDYKNKIKAFNDGTK